MADKYDQSFNLDNFDLTKTAEAVFYEGTDGLEKLVDDNCRSVHAKHAANLSHRQRHPNNQQEA